jgi:hypothetical protein
LGPAANETDDARLSALDDAMDLDRKRPADWLRRPDRGGGSARRRMEQHLFSDTEREAELARVQETIRQIQEAAAEKQENVARLERAVAEIDGSEPAPKSAHLLFAWEPEGYRLHEDRGDAPAVGTRVSVNGREYAVAKLARSPLPGDARRCAFLQPL